ncbi:hypothetical protein SAMN05443551_2832 [Marivita hallyeonensis]|uniref:Uncharacterized protein n=1 Tax=Marivita hallyeonensis TaxID=996342 RepID=A0A1M5VEL5_9RHOB|nr:hypothetical protein SAMN05443551_2832 [Marivita hallyeonensis]
MSALHFFFSSPSDSSEKTLGALQKNLGRDVRSVAVRASKVVA